MFSFLSSLPNQTLLYLELLIVPKISQIQFANGHQRSLQTGVQHFWLWYTEFLFNTSASLKKMWVWRRNCSQGQAKAKCFVSERLRPITLIITERKQSNKNEINWDRHLKATWCSRAAANDTDRNFIINVHLTKKMNQFHAVRPSAVPFSDMFWNSVKTITWGIFLSCSV